MKEALPLPIALAAALYLPVSSEQDPVANGAKQDPPKTEQVTSTETPPKVMGGFSPRALALRGMQTQAPARADVKPDVKKEASETSTPAPRTGLRWD